jgi:hypothetical protein
MRCPGRAAISSKSEPQCVSPCWLRLAPVGDWTRMGGRGLRGQKPTGNEALPGPHRRQSSWPAEASASPGRRRIHRRAPPLASAAFLRVQMFLYSLLRRFPRPPSGAGGGPRDLAPARVLQSYALPDDSSPPMARCEALWARRLGIHYLAPLPAICRSFQAIRACSRAS